VQEERVQGGEDFEAETLKHRWCVCVCVCVLRSFRNIVLIVIRLATGREGEVTMMTIVSAHGSEGRGHQRAGDEGLCQMKTIFAAAYHIMHRYGDGGTAGYGETGIDGASKRKETGLQGQIH
jgi:hypothetical protein